MLTRDARARLAAQIPDQEKAGRCDYVIDNTGSLDETRTLVEEIYRELLQAALDRMRTADVSRIGCHSVRRTLNLAQIV